MPLQKSFSVQITPSSILCCEPFSKLFECDLQRLGHPKATRFSDMLLFYTPFCPFVWTVIYTENDFRKDSSARSVGDGRFIQFVHVMLVSVKAAAAKHP